MSTPYLSFLLPLSMYTLTFIEAPFSVIGEQSNQVPYSFIVQLLSLSLASSSGY